MTRIEFILWRNRLVGHIRRNPFRWVWGVALASAAFFIAFILPLTPYCSLPYIKTVCQVLHLPGVPTFAEDEDWKAARSGKSCDAYKRIFDADGFYANRAKAYYDMGKHKSIRQPFKFRIEADFEPDVAISRSILPEHRSSIKAQADKRCEQMRTNGAGVLGPSLAQDIKLECKTRSDVETCQVTATGICNLILESNAHEC